MSVLSAQSIRTLCEQWESVWLTGRNNHCRQTALHGPMISPFVRTGTIRGRSYGLSACSYDCRIADALVVPVGQSRLASTIERFNIPTNICGSVLDKSTWARVFLTAFNTHLDPGWTGHLTVELANLGPEVVEFLPGDPLVQVKFEWLDDFTELPYNGKYQNQEPGPQGPRYAKD
jgi:dCTP deaminase